MPQQEYIPQQNYSGQQYNYYQPRAQNFETNKPYMPHQGNIGAQYGYFQPQNLQNLAAHDAQIGQSQINPMQFYQGNFPQENNLIYQTPRGIHNKPRDTFLRRLRLIPIFNGETFAQLREFIEVAESLFISRKYISEEDEFYEQILLQLRGEARNIVLTLNEVNWDSIKKALLKNFNYLANKEILMSQLENARQEEN